MQRSGIDTIKYHVSGVHVSFADPEGGGGGGGGNRRSGPPLKNHKNIGFPSNIGPDPLKITKQNYLVSIQCWAIIGMPAKPVSLAS